MDLQIHRASLDGEPFLVFKNDTGVSQTISDNSSYGFGELGVYEDILDEHDTFFDVGLNIGAISFQLKKRKKELKIFGFEPVKEFFALATKNLSDFSHTKCFNVAVSDVCGSVNLNKLDLGIRRNYGAIQLYQNGEDYLVKSTTLNEMSDIANTYPKLVKIDVEGFEFRVLKGMNRIFHKNLHLSIEADRPKIVADYIPFLKKNNFNLYFGHLKVTNLLNQNRNKSDDRKSTVHIFASFIEPSPRMKLLLQPISDFDQYLRYASPILGRV